MIIGGLQKNSFIDFPGRISCVLFSSGCNFHCPYCHNPELARGLPAAEPALTLEHFYAFLAARRSLLEGVVISGGEPTLQADLAAVCQAVKDLGFEVKLDTNGSRPRVLRHLLAEGLIDYVAMDIKTDPSRYAPVFLADDLQAAIQESLRIILTSAPAYEFRTTCVGPIVDEGVIDTIAHLIEGADRYVLQTFQNQRLLNPSFFQPAQPAISGAQMRRLQAVASKWVGHCLIR
ncbi:MAG: anaerobic ribonucleoside-triphosphate reductase activating protein [Desulfobacterales bacterium]